jgi:hypothetical protein
MSYFWASLIGLLLGLLGGFIGARMRYKALLRADKQPKILSKGEKAVAMAMGEAIVKLDFPSLIKDMELKYKMWVGHKHQRHVGIWINWVKCILDKKGNTK